MAAGGIVEPAQVAAVCGAGRVDADPIRAGRVAHVAPADRRLAAAGAASWRPRQARRTGGGVGVGVRGGELGEGVVAEEAELIATRTVGDGVAALTRRLPTPGAGLATGRVEEPVQIAAVRRSGPIDPNPIGAGRTAHS